MSELLVLTNAKTQSFSECGGFFDSLKPWQINAALAGCDPLGELILRCKYLQEKPRNTAFFELFKKSYRFLKKKKTLPKRLDSQAIVGRLLNLYFIEEYSKNLCPKCRGRMDEGRGTVFVDPRGITRRCNRCGGSGNISWTDRQRYEQIEVKRKQWENHYRDNYRALAWYLHPIMIDAEYAAKDHLFTNLP